MRVGNRTEKLLWRFSMPTGLRWRLDGRFEQLLGAYVSNHTHDELYLPLEFNVTRERARIMRQLEHPA
jgi:hypothetical protein